MKEMSDQVRVAIAAVLSLVVIVAYSLIVKPQKPPQTPDQAPPAAVVGNAPAAPAGPGPTPGTTVTPVKPATPAAPAAPISVPAVAAPTEKSVVVESGLYRVELWNRGGVVQSWQLANYYDDNQPPRTLDVVHADAARMEDAWPFSVVLNDPQEEAAANSGLYVITSNGAPAGDTIKAPAQIELTWSDGHLEVRKVLKFAENYEMSGELTVKLNGQPIPANLAWRGGFGNLVVRTGMMSRGVIPVQVLYSQAGKLTTLPVQKVGQPKQPTVPSTIDGPLDYAGIEDQYFAAVFLRGSGRRHSRYRRAAICVDRLGRRFERSAGRQSGTATERGNGGGIGNRWTFCLPVIRRAKRPGRTEGGAAAAQRYPPIWLVYVSFGADFLRAPLDSSLHSELGLGGDYLHACDQHAVLSAEDQEHARRAKNAEGGSGNQSDPGEI